MLTDSGLTLPLRATHSSSPITLLLLFGYQLCYESQRTHLIFIICPLLPSIVLPARSKMATVPSTGGQRQEAEERARQRWIVNIRGRSDCCLGAVHRETKSGGAECYLLANSGR